MIQTLKETKNPNPYPHKFHVSHNATQFIKSFDHLLPEKNTYLDFEVSVAGRVTNLRTSGKSLVFYDIVDNGVRLQVLCNESNNTDTKSFPEVHEYFRRGDIIGVRGRPGRSKAGEISISPGKITLLSPCLHQLPK